MLFKYFHITFWQIAFILQMTVLFGYAIAGRFLFYFEIPAYLVFLLIGTAVICEFIFEKLSPRSNKTTFFIPYSSIIVGLSCSLLIDSVNFSAYFFAVITAMLSKYILHIKEDIILTLQI